MRRDPPFEHITPVNLPSVNGTATVFAADSGINPGLVSVSVASLGAAGTATFSTTPGGTTVKVLAVEANASADAAMYTLELGVGQGLEVTTTTAMAVDVLYIKTSAQAGITKSAARAASYNAYKTATTKAIRTPNRFGAQTEG